MRPIRTSTWILTAIFLAALVTYVLVKPTSAATVSHSRARQHSATRTSAPRTPLPGAPSASPSPSPTPSPHSTATSSPSASSTHPTRTPSSGQSSSGPPSSGKDFIPLDASRRPLDGMYRAAGHAHAGLIPAPTMRCRPSGSHLAQSKSSPRMMTGLLATRTVPVARSMSASRRRAGIDHPRPRPGIRTLPLCGFHRAMCSRPGT